MFNLPQQYPFNQYTGDGTTAIYAYAPWLALLPTDLAVYVTLAGAQANPANDIQPYPTAYTVQNAGNLTGGTITFQTGYIPPVGAIITIDRAMQISSDTDFSDPQTFSGPNLDAAIQRITLIQQQLNVLFQQVCLSYPVNSYSPTPKTNTIPQLGANQIWIGDPTGNGKVGAQTLEENPDVSVLRSQLANAQSGQDGVGLIGLYDTADSTSKTLRTKFIQLASNTGFAYLGAQNPVDGAAMTLQVYLQCQAFLPQGWVAQGYAQLDSIAPNVWLLYQDGTIGNAASAATRLASAVAQRLFVQLWTVCADAQCPVSGGRGANGLADFNANKTITLPSTNGRTIVNFAGTYALGAVFGEATHTLSGAEIPVTTPTYNGNFKIASPSGTEQTGPVAYLVGNGVRSPDLGFAPIFSETIVFNDGGYVGSTQQAIEPAPINPFGGGAAHNNTQPSTAMLCYIKL